MNVSIFPQPSLQMSVLEMTVNVLPVYYCYAAFGILACISNFVVIFVYTSEALLRAKFSLYIGLAAADFINGLGFAFTGISRLQVEFALSDVYVIPQYRRYECATEIGNILQVVGSQWPALITCGLGIERFFAVKYPMSYRNYKIRMYHGLLFSSFFVSLVSILVALYIGVVLQRMAIAYFPCSLSSAYGFEYSTFNYFLTMLGHVFGFILNTAALYQVRHAARKVGAYNTVLKGEYTKVKIMLGISGLSVVMVVLPNLFLYTSRFFLLSSNYILLGWIYCLFALRSVFNLVVIGFGVKEFKLQFHKLLPCYSKHLPRVSVETSRTGPVSLQELRQPRFVKVATTA